MYTKLRNESNERCDHSMRERFVRFMYGRYGMDKLGISLIVTSMVITLLSSWFRLDLIIVSYALLIWEIFRYFSKNTYKRSRENVKFLSLTANFKKRFSLVKNKIRDRKTHRYFECTTCHNNLRVPKGKGEIRVTCPVCKTITIIKT